MPVFLTSTACGGATSPAKSARPPRALTALPCAHAAPPRPQPAPRPRAGHRLDPSHRRALLQTVTRVPCSRVRSLGAAACGGHLESGILVIVNSPGSTSLSAVLVPSSPQSRHICFQRVQDRPGSLLRCRVAHGCPGSSGRRRASGALRGLARLELRGRCQPCCLFSRR